MSSMTVLPKSHVVVISIEPNSRFGTGLNKLDSGSWSWKDQAHYLVVDLSCLCSEAVLSELAKHRASLEAFGSSQSWASGTTHNAWNVREE